MKTHNCGLYIRVSTQRQANVEDGSLDAQEAKLRAYVNYESKNSTPSSPSWKVIEVYREEGKSAKNLNRPEFQRMMTDAESGKINTIIIWKIDRLSRSLKDFTSLWDTFQEKGIQLISLNDKFDTNCAIGRAMLHIVLVFAQLEREQTAERTINVMQYRAEKGMWNGGRVIGYDLDRDNKGVLIINPEQSKLVKKAFELCIEKGSAGQTQKILNELGYRMPTYKSRRGKRHGDKLFTKQSIVHLLTNPIYTGKISWSGKSHKGNHKPIVDKKTFNKVQEILNSNRKTRNNEKGPKKYIYLLSGILRCGKCGSMMTPKGGKNGSGQPYHYYQCTRNSHIGKSGCRAKYVPATPLEDFVKERLIELSTKEDEINDMISKANKNNDNKLEILQKERMRLETALSQVKAKLNTLISVIETGQKFKTFKERIQQLEDEREKIENQIDETGFAIEKVGQEILSGETIRKNFKQLTSILNKANPQQLKELLYNIIEVVEFFESEDDQADGHIKISYFEQPNLTFPPPSNSKNTKSEQRNETLFAPSMKWLPTTDSEHYRGRFSKYKEIHILVKMYRRRGKGTSISLYDPLPSLPQKPAPVYKNIVAMAVKVNEYLVQNPQKTYTSAGNHFGVTRARISQLMTIHEKLPDDFIEMMGQCADRNLIKRFSGKTLLKIAAKSEKERQNEINHLLKKL